MPFSSALYQRCTFDTLPMLGQSAEACSSSGFEMNVCEPLELMLGMLHLRAGPDKYSHRATQQLLVLQAAYENADSAAMALQAVAPIGLKHLQSDKLVVKQGNLQMQAQLASS